MINTKEKSGSLEQSVTHTQRHNGQNGKETENSKSFCQLSAGFVTVGGLKALGYIQLNQ